MGRVSESDIKAAVKSEDFAPLYLFIGSESFLSAHYSAKIAEKSVDGDEAVFNLFRFDPYNFTAEDFLSAALQYPMMSDRKCITVSDMNIDALTESEWKKLIACLCDPPKWCVIIFYYTGISFTKSKNARWKEFYAVCEKQGQVCEFLRLTETPFSLSLRPPPRNGGAG